MGADASRQSSCRRLIVLTRPLSAAPIIVTATMGAADQRWADALRQTHYPAERNCLPAHITLFHHLPPSAHGALRAQLREHARSPTPDAQLVRPYSLGGGVALLVRSDAIMAMRTSLAEYFHGQLLPQDQAAVRLHITIQNKVSAQRAHGALALISQTFVARPLAITGLAMWHYCNGPWSKIADFPFRGGPKR